MSSSTRTAEKKWKDNPVDQKSRISLGSIQHDTIFSPSTILFVLNQIYFLKIF